MIEYHTHFLPTDFVIIGCGGTGSRLVPLVAQFLSQANWLPVKRLVLVDFDSVEEKNLERQNFTRTDIGVNKAEAMGRRYGRHFGLDYLTITERITIKNLSDINLNSAVVFCCVDSMDARRQVIQTLGYYFNQGVNPQNRRLDCFFIDAGNEDTFGQVKVNTLACVAISEHNVERITEEAKRIPLIISKPYVLNKIPLDGPFYRIPNSEVKASCAERDQTLAINTLMAATQFAFFQDFMYHKPLTTFEVRCSTQGGGWTPITPRTLLEYNTVTKSGSGYTTSKRVQNALAVDPGSFSMPINLDYNVVYVSDIVDSIIAENPVEVPTPVKTDEVDEVAVSTEEAGATEVAEAPTPTPALTAEMLAAAIAGARRL